jgi:hypothetical protein
MKNCPFCSARIAASLAECPSCTRVLVERAGQRQVPTLERAGTVLQAEIVSTSQQWTFARMSRQQARRVPIFTAALIVTMLLVLGVMAVSKQPGGVNPITPAPVTVQGIPGTAVPSRVPSPPNGTVLESGSALMNGFGVLRVDNQTGFDPGEVGANRLSVGHYVHCQQRSSHILPGISDGEYGLDFELGQDWGGWESGFRQAHSFTRFDKPFVFETSETVHRALRDWTTYNVSLHVVPGGTAKTSAVSPDEFLRH